MKSKKYLPSLLATIAIIYLIFSAIQWDLNPGHWSAPARVFCIIVMLIAKLLGPVPNPID